jgi:hypothetical protein
MLRAWAGVGEGALGLTGRMCLEKGVRLAGSV